MKKTIIFIVIVFVSFYNLISIEQNWKIILQTDENYIYSIVSDNIKVSGDSLTIFIYTKDYFDTTDTFFYDKYILDKNTGNILNEQRRLNKYHNSNVYEFNNFYYTIDYNYKNYILGDGKREIYYVYELVKLNQDYEIIEKIQKPDTNKNEFNAFIYGNSPYITSQGTIIFLNFDFNYNSNDSTHKIDIIEYDFNWDTLRIKSVYVDSFNRNSSWTIENISNEFIILSKPSIINPENYVNESYAFIKINMDFELEKQLQKDFDFNIPNMSSKSKAYAVNSNGEIFFYSNLNMKDENNLIERKVIVTKYDNDLNLLWVSDTLTFAQSEYYFNSMYPSNDGGLFIFYQVRDGSLLYHYISKFDSNGVYKDYNFVLDLKGEQFVKRHITLYGNDEIYLRPPFMDASEQRAILIKYTINDSSVSVEEIFSSSKINIYPNPAKDILYIQSENSISRIEINDILGRNVASYNYTNFENINISTLSPGMYFIKIFQENGNIINEKIIIGF